MLCESFCYISRIWPPKIDLNVKNRILLVFVILAILQRPLSTRILWTLILCLLFKFVWQRAYYMYYLPWPDTNYCSKLQCRSQSWHKRTLIKNIPYCQNWIMLDCFGTSSVDLLCWLFRHRWFQKYVAAVATIHVLNMSKFVLFLSNSKK